MPSGICTVESSESSPSISDDFMGSPITGSSGVPRYHPRKVRAFPAAAIITSTPFSLALSANSAASPGDRLRRHNVGFHIHAKAPQCIIVFSRTGRVAFRPHYDRNFHQLNPPDSH
jgi:hypothetical protein